MKEHNLKIKLFIVQILFNNITKKFFSQNFKKITEFQNFYKVSKFLKKNSKFS